MEIDLKKLIVPVIGLVVLIVLIVLVVKAPIGPNDPTATPTPNASNNPNVANILKIRSNDWTLGIKGSNVELIVYSNLTCPACAYYHPIIEQMAKDLNGKLVVAFRHFPFHQNADLAAYAAEAAGIQGKFWEMTDVLFENSSTWAAENDPITTFSSYAKNLGIDVSKFKTDYISSSVRNVITESMNDVSDLGINATPTFFINGKKVTEYPNDLAEFKAMIQAELDKAKLD
jgi:protein-disulfide isomerase